MGVFDNSIKTPLRVPDPGSDDTLPSSGALSFGAMTSPTALAGTTGADAKLIHGDRWEQVEQNHTKNILGNDTFMVMGNQSHTITGNLTATVAGNVNDTVVGSHNFLQVGPKNDVHNSPHTRLNCSPETQQEPTNKIRMFGIECEVKATENTIIANKLEIVTNCIGLTTFQSEMIGTSIGMKGISIEMEGLCTEMKGVELELKPLKTIALGAEVKAGGGVAAVIPSVNAVPHPPTMGGT